MKNIILFLLLNIFFAGCNNNSVFKEYRKMDNVSWNKFDVQEFEVPVVKGKPIDLLFALRHHTSFPYKFIDVNVTFYTPDGEIRSKDYHYRLIGTDLKWKGDGMGELWDIELPIRRKMTFKKSGICKITIESRMNKLELPGIIEVGLIVNNTE